MEKLNMLEKLLLLSDFIADEIIEMTDAEFTEEFNVTESVLIESRITVSAMLDKAQAKVDLEQKTS